MAESKGLAKKYQKKSDREHVLDNPDTYTGSMEKTQYGTYIYDTKKQSITYKELEIIQAEITNSGKPKEMAEKIARGKLSKFLNDNSLLSQIWILDPKKKVEDVLKENSLNKQIKIVDFVKFKVGEGV